MVPVGVFVLVEIVVVVDAQIVDVSTLAVHEFAEETETAHVEREKLGLAVAAVLELHAVHACLLGGLDEFPALVEGERAGDLDESVLPRAHRIERHRDVQLPRRRVVHAIDAIPIAHRLVGVLAHELPRRRTLGVLEPLLLAVHRALPDVAERGHLDARNAGDAVHRTAAAGSDADASDADLLHRLDGKTEHRSAGAESGPLLCAHASRRNGGGAHPGCSLEKVTTVSFHFSSLSFCWLDPDCATRRHRACHPNGADYTINPVSGSSSTPR